MKLFSTLLKSLLDATAATPRLPVSDYRLRFESLEPRLLLSADLNPIAATFHDVNANPSAEVMMFAPAVPVVDAAATDIGHAADRLGLTVADTTVQHFLLDFDGAQGIVYNGPVSITGLDVSAFTASKEISAAEQADLKRNVVDLLNTQFASLSAIFHEQLPADFTGEYSTIYVGGRADAFDAYGTFLGVSEKVDQGNQDRSDKAFVFGDNFNEQTGNPANYALDLAALIGHEAGHLIGFEHAHTVHTGDASDVLAEVAFKPYTHVEIAKDVRQDILDDGAISINGLPYQLHASVRQAVEDYPDYFYGGATGPDAFPDIAYGQSIIHGESTGLWLGHILDAAWAAQTSSAFNAAERSQILAWSYGFLTHAAGDIWSHTLVNEFTGGVFPTIKNVVSDVDALSNAIRHILVEEYILDATPGSDGNADRTLLPNGDVSDDGTNGIGINAPIRFIYEALIKNLPDLPDATSRVVTLPGSSGRQYLTEGTNLFSVAASTYVAELEAGVLSSALIAEFKNRNITLASDTVVVVNQARFEWEVRSSFDEYEVRLNPDGTTLSVNSIEKSRGIPLNVFIELRRTLADIAVNLPAPDLNFTDPFKPLVDQALGNANAFLRGEPVDVDALLNSFKDIFDQFRATFGTIIDELIAGRPINQGALASLGSNYINFWLNNLDRGIENWGEVGLAISRSFFAPDTYRTLQNFEGQSYGPDVPQVDGNLDAFDRRGGRETSNGLIDTLDVLESALEDPNQDRQTDDSFVNRYLLSMLGLPPSIGELRAGFQSILLELRQQVLDPAIEIAPEVIAQPITQLIDYITGFIGDYVKDFLREQLQERYGFDLNTYEFLTQIPEYFEELNPLDIESLTINGQIIPLFAADARETLDQYLGFTGTNHLKPLAPGIPTSITLPDGRVISLRTFADATGRLLDNAEYDKTQFDAYANSVTLSKLLLLGEDDPLIMGAQGPGQLSALFSNLSGQPYDFGLLNQNGAHGGNILTATLPQPGVLVQARFLDSNSDPQTVLLPADVRPWLNSIDTDFEWRGNNPYGFPDANNQYPTGTGNFPLWESSLLRPAFRELFDDWYNLTGLEENDFPDLGDVLPTLPNDPNDPRLTTPIVSFVTIAPAIFNFGEIARIDPSGIDLVISGSETVILSGDQVIRSIRGDGLAGFDNLTLTVDGAVRITGNVGGAGLQNLTIFARKISLADKVEVSVRQIATGGNSQSAVSIADSGDLSLFAPVIEIGKEAKLLAHGDGGFAAGDVSLTSVQNVDETWSFLGINQFQLSEAVSLISLGAGVTVTARNVNVSSAASTKKSATVERAFARATTATVVGDVDNDGDLDLIVGNAGQAGGGATDVENRNRLYLNNGSGVYGAGIDIAPQSQATRALALGDLDGDGDLDLVVGNFNEVNRFYLNDGAGGFSAGVAIGSDADATNAVALGDVDGDGDLDLVAGNGGTTGQTNRLYLNNGSGGFGPGVNLSTDAHNTRAVILRDLDNDGDLDFIAGNQGALSRVYLNDGLGTFGPGVEIADIQRATTALAAGDVDGDGDVDLISGNAVGPNRVYLNNGSGAFGAGLDISADNFDTRSLALGDIDGDGDLDLAAGNYGGANRAYLNNGFGIWSVGRNITADADATTALALADIDRDGDLDVLAGNDRQVFRVYETESTTAQLGFYPGQDLDIDVALLQRPQANDGITVSNLKALGVVSESLAQITLGAGASILASNNITIGAFADAQTNIITNRNAWGITYGSSSPTAKVIVENGAALLAGNDVVLSARANNDLDVTTFVPSLGEQTNIALSLGRARANSLVDVQAGALIQATDASVLAQNHNRYSNIAIAAGFGSSGDSATGLAFALGFNQSSATAQVSGTVTVSGDLLIDAQSINERNNTRAFGSVNGNPLGSVANEIFAFFQGTPFQEQIDQLTLNFRTAQTPEDGYAAGFAFVTVDNVANALIGDGASILVGGNLTVKATASDTLQISASGNVGDFVPVTDTAVSGAFVYAAAANQANAFIGLNTIVDVGNALLVDSLAEIKSPVSFTDVLLNFVGLGSNLNAEALGAAYAFGEQLGSQVNNALDSRVDGISNNINQDQTGTSFIHASGSTGSGGSQYGGGIALINTYNAATAAVASGARVNRRGTQSTTQDVTIRAQGNTDLLNIASNLSVLSFLNSEAQTGIGGFYENIVANNYATAYIDDLAQVSGRDVMVAATTAGDLFGLATAGQFVTETAIDGAVFYHDVTNRTDAFIEDRAWVDARRDVKVNASSDLDITTVSGALSASGDTAVGISAAFSVLDNQTRAFIGNAEGAANPGGYGGVLGQVTAGQDITVNAVSDSDLFTIAIAGAFGDSVDSGGSASDSSQTGSGFGLAGDAALNIVKETTEAFIRDAVTVGAGNNLSVLAVSGGSYVAAAGSVSYADSSDSGSSSGIQFSGSSAQNRLTQLTQSYVTDVTASALDLNIKSTSDYALYNLAAGFSGASNDSWAVSGSGNYSKIDSTDLAYVGAGADISVRDLSVIADHDLLLVSVAGAYSSGESSFGGGLELVDIQQRIQAWIAPGVQVTASGDVRVFATNESDVFSIAAAVATTEGDNGVGISGSFSFVDIDSDVQAYIRGGRITAGGSVYLDADDDLDIVSIAGQYTSANIGVGLSAANIDIQRTVRAFIDGNAVVDAQANGLGILDPGATAYGGRGVTVDASAGGTVVGFALGFADAGSVGVVGSNVDFDLSGQVEAFIAGAIVRTPFVAGAGVRVRGQDSTTVISIAGDYVDADSVGFGIANAHNEIGGDAATPYRVSAYLDNAVVSSDLVDVQALATGSASAITVGVQNADTAAIGVSVSRNDTYLLVDAHVSNSAQIDGGSAVSLSARNGLALNAASGQAAFSDSTAAVGLGFSQNTTHNVATVRIDNASVRTQDLSLVARSDGVITALAAGGAFADTFALAVTASRNVTDDVVDARIQNGASVRATSVSVTGTDASRISSLTGSAVSADTVAIGASFSENKVGNRVSAVIDAADIQANSLILFATSDMDVVAAAAAGAISDTFVLAASVAQNDVSNGIDARIQNGALVRATSIAVTATDTADISNTTGSAVVADTVAIGASFSENKIRNRVSALIDAADIQSGSIGLRATSELSARANAAAGGAAETVVLVGSFARNDVANLLDAAVFNVAGLSSGALSVAALDQSSVTARVGAGAGSEIIAIAGSLADNLIRNVVTARIENSTGILLTGALSVAATDAARFSVIVGVGAGAEVVALGAAAGLNTIANRTQAFVSNSSITALTGAVAALSSQATAAFVASGAGAEIVAATGSFATTDIANTIEAHVSNVIGLTTGALNVSASDRSSVVTRAGTGAGAGIVALGGSVSKSKIRNQVSALIDTFNIQTGSTVLSATSNQNIDTVAAGGAGAGIVAVLGSTANNDVLNEVTALLTNATGLNSGALSVSALDQSSVIVRAATGAGAGIVAVGASSSVNEIRNLVSAVIDTDIQSDSITLSATADQYIEAAAAAGSGAGIVAVAGAFARNDVANVVDAAFFSIAGLTTGALSVAALDQSSVIALVGAGAGAAIVAAVGSAAENEIRNTITARLENSTDIMVTGALSITATDAARFSTIVGGGVGAGVVALGAVLSKNDIANQTSAAIINSSIAAQTGVVEAQSAQRISTFAAAGAGAAIVGVDAVSAQTFADNRVNAQIYGNTTRVSSSGDFSLQAIDKSSVITNAGAGAGAAIVAFAASVAKNEVRTELLSSIDRGAGLTSGTRVNVIASDQSTVSAFIGAGSGAGIVAVGVASAINDLSGSVKAMIGNARITAPIVSVLANSLAEINSIGGGGAGAAIVAAATVISENNLSGVLSATIGVGAIIDATALSIIADDDSIIRSITAVGAGAAVVGAGIATSNNLLANTTEAVLGNALVSAGSIQVLATSGTAGDARLVAPIQMTSIGERDASGRLSIERSDAFSVLELNEREFNSVRVQSYASAGGGAAIAGVAILSSKNDIRTVIRAYLDGFNYSADASSLSVIALDETTVRSAAFTGAGAIIVAGSVVSGVNEISTAVEAYTRNSNIRTGSLSLHAEGRGTIRSVVVAAGGAGVVSITGFKSTNEIQGTIRAALDTGTQANVIGTASVSAADYATIVSHAGEGGGAIVGLGAGQSENMIGNTVSAYIGQAVLQAGALDVHALADNILISQSVAGNGGIVALQGLTADNRVFGAVQAYLALGAQATVTGAASIRADDRSDIMALVRDEVGGVVAVTNVQSDARVTRLVEAYLNGSLIAAGDILVTADTDYLLESNLRSRAGGIVVITSLDNSGILAANVQAYAGSNANVSGRAITIRANGGGEVNVNTDTRAIELIAVASSSTDAVLSTRTSSYVATGAQLSATGGIVLEALNERTLVGGGIAASTANANVATTSFGLVNDASATALADISTTLEAYVARGAGLSTLGQVEVRSRSSNFATSRDSIREVGIIFGDGSVALKSVVQGRTMAYVAADLDVGSLVVEALAADAGYSEGTIRNAGIVARRNAFTEVEIISDTAAYLDAGVLVSTTGNLTLRAFGDADGDAITEGSTRISFDTGGRGGSLVTINPKVNAYVGTGATVDAGGNVRIDTTFGRDLAAQSREFNPANAVNNANDTVNFGQPHGFQEGDFVIYSSGDGEAVGGLVDQNTYSVLSVANPASPGGFDQNAIRLGSAFDIPALTASSPNQFRAIDVDISDPSLVVPNADTIQVVAHRLLTGDRVVYETTGQAIGGLVSGQAYFVIRINDNFIQLASSAANAATGVALAISAENLTGGAHTLRPSGAYSTFNVGDVGTLADPMGAPTRDNAIRIAQHNLATGDRVTYEVSGQAIGGLVAGRDYFVIRATDNLIQLAASRADANAGIALALTPAPTDSSQHALRANNGAFANFGLGNVDIAADPGAVNASANTIRIAQHNLTTGSLVVYETNGLAIGGLVSGREYFAVRVSEDFVQLAVSLADAEAGIAIVLAPAAADLSLHTLRSSGVYADSNIIRFNAAHSFDNEDRVVYRANGGVAIGGLVDGATYRVEVIDSVSIKLYATTLPESVDVKAVNITPAQDIVTTDPMDPSIIIDITRVEAFVSVTDHGFADGQAVIYRSSQDNDTFLSNETDVNETIGVSMVDGVTVYDLASDENGVPIGDDAADNIYLPGHTYQTGDRVRYNANGPVIGGLVDGQEYFVIANLGDLNIEGDELSVKLALTAADATAGIAIVLTPDKTDTSTQHRLNYVGGQVIGGLVEGGRYFVQRIDADNFRLSSTPGGAAIELTNENVFGTHSLVADGVDLTLSAATGRQEFALDLDASVATGSAHRFIQSGGADGLAFSGDGIATAITRGKAAGVFGARNTDGARVVYQPNASASIEDQANVRAAGNVLISSRTLANSSADAINSSRAGISARGNVNALTETYTFNSAFVGANAAISAGNTFSLTADSSENTLATAGTKGGALFSGRGTASVGALVNFDNQAAIQSGSVITAGFIDIKSLAAVTASTNASAKGSGLRGRANAGGFGVVVGGIPGPLAGQIAKADNLIDIGSNARLEATDVSLRAETTSIATTAYAYARARGFKASANASAPTFINDLVQVQLDPYAQVTGLESVTISAIHDKVTSTGQAIASASGFRRKTSSDASITQNTNSVVDIQQYSLITSKNLQISAITREATSNQGGVNPHREIIFNGDAYLLQLGPLPELVIAEDGSVLSQSLITFTQTPTHIILDDISNRNALGTIRFDVNQRPEQDGLLTGTRGVVTFQRAFETLRIENYSSKDLVIQNLDPINRSAQAQILTSVQSVPISVDIVQDYSSDLTIRNFGKRIELESEGYFDEDDENYGEHEGSESQPALWVHGLINNPQGTTTLSNVWGDIVATGAQGVIRSNELNVRSTYGNVGAKDNGRQLAVADQSLLSTFGTELVQTNYGLIPGQAQTTEQRTISTPYNLINSAVTPAQNWSSARLLENNVSAAATDAQIKYDANGNGLAIWIIGADLYYSSYSAATESWSSEAKLDGSLTGTPSKAHLSVSSNGNALVTWVQNNNIYAQRYVAGVWDGASSIPLLENASGVASNPVGAINDTGRAIVSFIQTDGTRYNLLANVHNGVAWGTVATNLDDRGTANNNALATSTSPSVALDAAGDATVVWQQRRGSETVDSIIFSRYSIASNTWANPNSTTIESSSTAALGAKIAFDSLGNGQVVWAQGSGSSYTLFAKSYTKSSNTWSAATFVLGSSSVNPNLNLALSANGNALVVWSKASGDIHARRFVNGAWAGTASESVEALSGTAVNPSGAINDAGQASVIFVQSDGTRNNVYANRYTTTWQSAQLLESSNNAIVSSVTPQVAIDGNGNIQGIWLQKNGAETSDSVYTNRYSNATQAYYLIKSGDTWASIATNLYGNNAVANELETYYGSPALTAGSRLANPPASVIDVQDVTVTVNPYYLVQAGDSFDSIATYLYGTTAVANELAAQYGNPILTTGLRLANLSAIVTDSFTREITVAPYYVVQAGDTFASITRAVYHNETPEAAAALRTALNNPGLTLGAKLTVPESIRFGAPTAHQTHHLNVELIRSSTGPLKAPIDLRTDLNVSAEQEVFLNVLGRLRDDPTTAPLVIDIGTIRAGGNVDIRFFEGTQAALFIDPSPTALPFAANVVDLLSTVGGVTKVTTHLQPIPGDQAFAYLGVFGVDTGPVETTYDATLIQAGGNIVLNGDITGLPVHLTANTNILGLGNINTLTSGQIELTEVQGDLRIGVIISTADDVLLTAANGSIIDMPAETLSDVSGVNIRLTALAGGIGSATNFLELNTAQPFPGVLRAEARDSIYLTETSGKLPVDLIRSRQGDVTLRTISGGIVDARNDSAVNVEGVNITLLPIGGGIGSVDNDLDLDSSNVAFGRLNAVAAPGIYINEVNGALNVLSVRSTLADVRLSVADSLGTGNDLVLLDGGSITAQQGVQLRAGDNLTTSASSRIQAGAGIVLLGDFGDADPGVGSVLDIGGVLSGASIRVTTGADADTITFNATDLNANTQVFAGSGADVITVDRLQTLNTSTSGVRDQLTVDGQEGSDLYRVITTGTIYSAYDSDEENSNNQRDYIVNVLDTGAAGSDALVIDGSASADVFALRAISSIAGQASNDPATVKLLNGQSVERINYDAAIDTQLTVNGNAGNDVFRVDDASAALILNGGDGADQFEVGLLYTGPQTTPAADAFTTVLTTSGYLSNGISLPSLLVGGNGADRFIVRNHQADLVLQGDAGADSFDIQSYQLSSGGVVQPGGNIIADGGNDNDSITVDSPAPVQVFGRGGYDLLKVRWPATDDSIVVTDAGIFGGNRYVTYADTESVELFADGGNDTFFVQSTGVGVDTRIFAGTGADTINVTGDVNLPIVADDPAVAGNQNTLIFAPQPHLLTNLRGGLTVDGGGQVTGSRDQLNLFNEQSTTNDRGVFTATEFAGFGMGGDLSVVIGDSDNIVGNTQTFNGGIRFTGLEAASLKLGTGADTLYVTQNLGTIQNLAITSDATDQIIVLSSGDDLQVAAAPSTVIETPALTQAALQPIVEEAKRRWGFVVAADVLERALASIVFEIVNLGGLTLAHAGTDRILIDATAAGYGWYVDANPMDDAEFDLALGNGANVLAGRIDLLTVVMHEIGHALGLQHTANPGDLLGATILPNERKTIIVDAAVTTPLVIDWAGTDLSKRKQANQAQYPAWWGAALASNASNPALHNPFVVRIPDEATKSPTSGSV